MDGIKKIFTDYVEYLDEIRRAVYQLTIIFILVFILGFFLTTPLVHFFVQFLSIKNVTLTTTSPFQLVDLAMNVGIFFALIVTLPLCVYKIYSFVRSGLLPSERRMFLWLLPIVLILFIVGFTYGFVALYYALKLIADVNIGLGVVNLWDISQFISQIVLTSTFLGVIFEFPIVVTVCIRLGLVNVNFLKSKRRHAWVAIFILVSLLPPTDGLSLVVMSVPLIVIYEVTIIVNRNKKYILLSEK